MLQILNLKNPGYNLAYKKKFKICYRLAKDSCLIATKQKSKHVKVQMYSNTRITGRSCLTDPKSFLNNSTIDFGSFGLCNNRMTPN